MRPRKFALWILAIIMTALILFLFGCKSAKKISEEKNYNKKVTGRTAKFR